MAVTTEVGLRPCRSQTQEVVVQAGGMKSEYACRSLYVWACGQESSDSSVLL